MGISIVEIHLISFSLLVTVSCKNLFQMKLTCVSRFKVQGSLLFVTYTIIQGIIGSEMLVRTGPLNGKCKKEK